jgi:phosphotransferase system enzyme I (PtsI)
MKICKGVSASPGLVLGQVSRLERHVETFSTGPFDPERELRQLEDAVRTAQSELDCMAERAASTEQAILQFQSMMLDDEGMMNEVRFCIKAGISAAAAMDKVGQRYADQLANMKDNPYMQLRSVDILDATSRVINILGNRPRMWLALDHPVILAADRLMPTDLFSVPSGMILGVVTTEGSGQSHAAIIARAMNIPGIVQVGPEFLDDCDGRTMILDATKGECILDPDAATRQQAEARICELQRENEEMRVLGRQPGYTRDGAAFELLANCFGPEDIDTAMQSGARGVGLLRSSYMMLPGRILDEQEQFYFYSSCLAAAQGCPVTVRTFDFGADRTMADAYQGVQSSKLGLRGIRNSLRQPRQFETQICALLRAAARGPLRVMFPMVTDVEDWDAAMHIVEHCRRSLRERGVPFNEKTPFGVMLSVPSACLTAEEFVAHGCDFLVIGTNDLTQYTHAADRELASAERYYRPASPAMKKLITMVMEAAKSGSVPVTICGLAVGNPVNTVQYLQMGLRSFSVSPQNLLHTKKALLEADAHPDDTELE